MTENIVKTREARIQEELWSQDNPQTTPSDMLQKWPTNSRNNEQMAQLGLDIELCLASFPPELKEAISWIVPRVEETYHNTDGWSKTMAIEASKAGTPSVGAEPEEKGHGLFGMFKGDKK